MRTAQSDPIGSSRQGSTAIAMADDKAHSIETVTALATERWSNLVESSDRSFRVGLACALTLHLLLMMGVFRAAAVPRIIGDENGSQDAISVSMVTEKEFDAKFAQEAMNAPAGAIKPPTPPPQPPPQPEQADAKPAEPPPPEKPAEETPPEPPVETAAIEAPPPPAEEKPPEAKPEEKSAEPPAKLAPTLADDLPDLLNLNADSAKAKTEKTEATKQETAKPKPKPKPVDAKQTPAQPPRQKQAALDLTPPSSFSGSGGAAGMQRPPGITRAGWNDAFARAVVAALRQTMPQLTNTRGRVTVRILLTENGNIKSVEVVRPSQVGGLDQSVVFATKQTNYPLPPTIATEADRTFLITYIYE